MAKRRRPGRETWGPAETAGPAGSPRRFRVGELLRHALAEVLSRETIREPAVAAVTITVSEVRPTPDLRQAICYVMPLGGANAEPVLAGLERLAPWLSGQVARRVRLKYAPRLSFRLDPSFDEADRIGALLRRPEVAADLVDGDGG